MTNDRELSPGLRLMQAAYEGMPKSMGDRERTNALAVLLQEAIRMKFVFRPGDAAALDKMSIHTCVGVFRPLDKLHYALSCREGGTYARMWEAHMGFTPWKAAVVAIREHELVEGNRVFTGMALLLPAAFTPHEDLATHKGLQVWWVTDVDAATINVCRYAPDLADGIARPFKRPGGAPARRRQFRRAEWAALQEQVTREWTSALQPHPSCSDSTHAHGLVA